MRIDLQLHSNYSDGYFTPTEVAEFIAKRGVKVASLTDHNTMHGQGEFKSACKRLGIKAINGIEIYSSFKRRPINILWYNYDGNHPEFHKTLRCSQIKRKAKVRKVLNKLKDRGFELEVDKIIDKYHYYIPVNHIVDDLIQNKNNFEKIKKELKTEDPYSKDLISEYFQNKDIWVLKDSYIDIRILTELKKKVGGQIVVCHPAKHHYHENSMWEKLREMGVDGLEIMSPHHSYNAIMHLQRMASEYDYITTGGSDFHLEEGGNRAIKNSWQYFKIDHKMLRKIDKIIG